MATCHVQIDEKEGSSRGRRLEDKTKHFRKLNEDQVDGKMVADTYRTTEIE